MGNVITLGRENRECDDCGAMAVTRRIEQQEFDYGVGADAVRLVADVPVWACAECGSAYMDEEGMTARHDAVCRHLKVLTPSEVRIVRGELTRQEFHDLVGIAPASMKRWEGGEQIQTTAMDLLLRLQKDPVGACRIRDIRRQQDMNADEKPKIPKFKTNFPPEVIERSQNFQLRKIG